MTHLSRLRTRMPGNALAPATVAASLFLLAGTYGALSTSEHPDEYQALWGGQYRVQQLTSGDVRWRATDYFTEPHWDPRSYWSLQGIPSTMMLYGFALAITPRTSAASLPYSYTDSALQGTKARPDRRSLIAARLAGVLASAIGIFLIGLRFRWGAVAAAVILLFPLGGVETFETFSRAWSEGPLLLAFGLISWTFGTRYFGAALGAGATVKLTVLGLWPLILLRRARGTSLVKAIVLMLATFVLLTPPSWTHGGPFYLLRLIDFRGDSYAGQSSDGLFLPSRYFWPFELAAILAIAWLIERVRSARRRESATRQHEGVIQERLSPSGED